MDDVISRQEVIDALDKHLQKTDVPVSYPGIISALTECVNELPPAQPDLSGYSDKLWQKAYERGKAEAQAEIIRCKDCKYWREHKYAKETKRYIPFCGLNAIYTKSDDFCNRAERRTDG